MAKIKGSKLSSKIAFVRRVYGEEMLAKVIESLPAGDRTEISGIMDIRWYPSELYDRLVTTICRTAAAGDESIYDRMGSETAEHQLSNIYAAFRRSDLVKMLKNMVPMHSHLNDPAQMEVEISGNEYVITVTQPKSTSIGCRIARAFYRRVAELAGGEDVRVVEETCTAKGDASCRFVIAHA